jgi:hypothetical protein
MSLALASILPMDRRAPQEIEDATASRNDNNPYRRGRDVRAGGLPEQHRGQTRLRANQLLGAWLILRLGQIAWRRSIQEQRAAVPPPVHQAAGRAVPMALSASTSSRSHRRIWRGFLNPESTFFVRDTRN